MNELHIRASQWYEDHDLEIEAFQHAAAASDIERAERLIQGKGIPLHLRGAVTAILDWLGSLPKSVLDARPSLWVRYASLLLVSGQTTGVEEKLQGAKSALALQSADHADRKGTDQAKSKSADQAGRNRTLVGQIAAARATLALTRYQVEAMITQSRRALENLRPDHVSFRTALWTLGFANQLQGDRAAASRALTAKPCRLARRPGISSLPSWRPSAWAICRKPITSCPWRPRLTGASCTWPGTRRSRLSRRRIWAWRKSSTNGTTWTPRNSTRGRACTWRGSMMCA